jgi:hypothetical protein
MPITRTAQPSFASGELAPSMYGRVDLSKYQSGLKRCLNFIVRPQGGVENRPGTYFVGKAPGAGRLIPFSYNVEQSYFLEFTNGIMRVIKDGGLVLRPLSDSDWKWTASGSGTSEYYLTTSADADPAFPQPASDEVFFSSTTATVGVIGSLSAGEWAWGDNDSLGFSTIYVRMPDSTDPDAEGDTAVSCTFRAVSPYPYAALEKVRFTQSADTMYLAHHDYAQRTLTRTDHHKWTFATITFAPTATAPTGLTATYSEGALPSRTISYQVSSIINGEESLPCTAVDEDVDTPWASGATVALSWSAVTGAEAYNVYKSSRGYFGWIGTVTGTTYTDDNIDPDVSDGPKESYNPFASSNYPGSVGIFEQRLVYAASDTDTQTIWASQTGQFYNFSKSRPLKDTDMIEVTIASRQVNEIRHIVPLDKLIVLTSGAEWIMDSGANSDALTPTSINLRVQSYRGCSDVPPLVIGSTVLFVQRDGATVQDLGYSFAVDKYEANNLSVLSQHLFDGKTVKEWAYQQRPNSVIWCIMSDGSLLSFTYLKEHEVWGWAQHSTDGTFESVAAIPGIGASDEVCFIVNRTICGSTVRYVEYLTDRQAASDVTLGVFLDSALSYSGAATTTLSGLDHLDGETVDVLADGSVWKGLTVTSGAVTIPQAATVAHAGLPIPTPTIEMLPLEVQGANGRKRRVTRLFARLEASRGMWAGPDTSRMTEAKWRSDEVYGEATGLFTGDKELLVQSVWGINGTLVIQQRDPLPLTINAVMPEIDLGG